MAAIAVSAYLAPPAQAQDTMPPAIPPGYVLATSGVVNQAQVIAVAIYPEAEHGPHTIFLIKPQNIGSKPEWFWIKNDDNSKSMERGEIAGLLMGAAEAYAWGGGAEAAPRYINITYITVDDRKIITAASLGVELNK